MNNFKKSFVIVSALTIVSNTIVSIPKSFANEQYQLSENYQIDTTEKIVENLKLLHPQFKENQIRSAVIQAVNGQQVVLPTDPNLGVSAFRAGWQGVTTGQLAFAINLAISIATGGAISNLASKLGSSALRSVRYSITAELAKWGASGMGQAFIETALAVADPGSFIANSIDSIDFYPNNGRINVWK